MCSQFLNISKKTILSRRWVGIFHLTSKVCCSAFSLNSSNYFSIMFHFHWANKFYLLKVPHFRYLSNFLKIDFSKELDTLTRENRTSLKKLKQKAAKKVEEERLQENITNALAEKEIDYLKRTVINLEIKQLAESCVRVCSRKLLNRKKRGMGLGINL